ncbi:MAG: site-2 protease family protein [Nanoarchaeota archaeon]|nr:site-2 protease family protein [Nanoarchaeota archaeon]
MTFASFFYANENNVLALILFLAFLVFVIAKRKRFEVQGRFIFFLYKTKLGLKWMANIARHRKAVNIYATIGVFAAFASIAFMIYLLVPYLGMMIQHPQTTTPALTLVLPVTGIPGVFGVPILYWIIVLILVVIFHEGSHGFVAISRKIKIKSSGFGFFLAVLPLAFVEPDEKSFERAKKSDQLKVLSAGSFTNILMGLLALGLYFLLSHFLVSSNLISFSPLIMHIGSVISGPALHVLPNNVSISQINGQSFTTTSQAISLMESVEPGQYVNLTTTTGQTYAIKSVYSSSMNTSTHSFIGNFSGVYFTYEGTQPFIISPISLNAFPENNPESQVLYWFDGLFLWMFVIALGVGLANFLPIFYITDGCKIVEVSLGYVIKDKKKRLMITNYIIIFFSIFLILLTPLGNVIFSVLHL